MKTEQQLLKLKREVDEAKQKVSELKGQRIALMKQLQTDWECKTVEEAERKLKSMTKEVEKISSSIEEGIEALEETYNV